MHKELKDFKSLLLESGFDVAVSTGNYDNANWFLFEKNGILGYVQFSRISGYSFCSVNKPDKKYGTGLMVFRNVYPAKLEYAEEIIKKNLSHKSTKPYHNLVDYITSGTNVILNYKIVKAKQRSLV